MWKRAIVWAALLSGCAAGGSEDSAAAGEFCETLEDGGQQRVVDGTGDAASGNLEIRLVTDESVDAHDPLFVAFRPYTLENIDQGGVQTTGKTTGDGLVEEVLGAGTWAFDAAYTRGSTTCLASLDVEVEAGMTTEACPIMSCPG